MKLRPKPNKFKFRDLQKTIIKKYRPTNSTNKSPFPSFPEFVQHIIDISATFTTGLDWRMNVSDGVMGLLGGKSDDLGSGGGEEGL